MAQEAKIKEEARLIGKKIRDMRIKREMTQEELAWKIEVSAQYISKVENGKGISLSMLIRIAKALQASPSELLEDAIDTDPEYDMELHRLINDCKNIYEKRFVVGIAKSGLDMFRQLSFQLQDKKD